MGGLSTIGAAAMAVIILSGCGVDAIAGTRAQWLVALSQRAMLQRIAKEQNAPSPKVPALPLAPIELQLPSDRYRPTMNPRQTHARAGWLALEKAAGPCSAADRPALCRAAGVVHPPSN